ncbi:GAF domain-containing protein [Kamptonema animale CS-326]|uniref:GAF domain-containing protein n=1 Tax=Kamptonema animale TaxID=92934 RepID=UPI00232FA328|nr:GAF domain-containing protein [Kamptonema animale]MDB9510803.1 GAF domain-containing protein [Kamptonema animale CS-326]
MPQDSLQIILDRLANNLKRDVLVQENLNNIRVTLDIDRVVLYYFYKHWKGQVTCESVNSSDLSIFGSTGPDECFNGEYAALYEAGRVRAIPDIETEPIEACHRNLLRTLKVRANLVVPILTRGGLWGLLIAHHCRGPHSWSASDIEFMQEKAKNIATSPVVIDN